MRRLFALLLMLLGWFQPGQTFAQKIDESLDTFYRYQLEECVKWLSSSGLDSIVFIDSLGAEDAQFVLYLRAATADIHQFTGIWRTNQQLFFSQHESKLEEKIFVTCAFILDLRKENFKLVIQADDPSLFQVKVTYVKGILQVEEAIAQTLSDPTFKLPSIAKNQIRWGKQKWSEDLSEGNIKYIRNLIIKALDEYYTRDASPARPWVSVETDLDTLLTDYNEFKYEVSNIQHEILKDESTIILGYWEYHCIHVEVIQQKLSIDIKLQLDGRFSDGIIWPESKQKFKYINTYYPDLVDAYLKQKLSTQVLKKLKND